MTQSFDELFWNRFDTLSKDTDLAYNFGSESYNEGYKAGAQSKQAKIDELQKRINEAIYDLQHIESAMWEEQVEHVLMVLKGDHS